MRGFFLLINKSLLIVCALVVASLSPVYADLPREQTRDWAFDKISLDEHYISPLSILASADCHDVTNQSVQVTMSNIGNFGMGTIEGNVDDHEDDDKRLIFGWPHCSSTTFTTLWIDNLTVMFGEKAQGGVIRKPPVADSMNTIHMEREVYLPPLPQPSTIAMGGYLDTHLTTHNGGRLNLFAVTLGNATVNSVEVYLNGSPTGLLVPKMSDSAFMLDIPIISGLPASRTLWELVAENEYQQLSHPWPYLVVE